MKKSYQKLALLISFLMISLVPSPVMAGERLLPYYSPPRPTIVDLENGMRLYLLEDHELPTFAIGLFLPVGSVQDPENKPGLASITVQAMRLGGTEKYTPDEINERLEEVNAKIEFEMTHEYGTLVGRSLTEDISLLLELIFEIVKTPRFDKKEFDTLKKRIQASLDHENEDPLNIAYREFPKLIYGEESPWARTLTKKVLKKISVDDCLRFYRDHITPDKMVLAISGDFKTKKIVGLIKNLTQNWSPTVKPQEFPPDVEKEWSPKSVFLTKDFTQSTVVLGHLGVKRTIPDKYALTLLNFILGGSGSITSRLGLDIRTQSGLAYAVWSQMIFGKTYGLFQAVAMTQTNNTTRVDEKMREIIGSLHEKPNITHQQLDQAKRALLRSLIFQYESRFNYVQALARFYFLGYPPDYFNIYRQEIAKVRLEEVNRVAKTYLHPDSLHLMIVGSRDLATSLKERYPHLHIRKIR
ncbi:MAG: hypothetical protein A3I75_00570 [Deltaproteobacteria bacterium RIFCSPLOWO2_02_FULL_50_16]|nr:MAG: hypothetical protein A3I75_00570 [Deltaproteobacteria bacterium RIFCSPLOWO2_02_FULL_50_16]